MGQSLWRYTNERIRKCAEQLEFGADDPLIVFCECARGCGEALQVSLTDYRLARALVGHFLVKEGHGQAASP